MTPLPDPRWKRFIDQSYRCSCCGEAVQGAMDVAYDHPDSWPHAFFRESDGPVREGRDRLSGDFCTIGDTVFLRGILFLKVMGTEETFAFGPWARVDPGTFRAYQSAFGTSAESKLGTHTGWLANELPCFPGSAYKALTIRFLGGKDRPYFELTDPSDLTAAQKHGISFDTLLDIHAAIGNDLRPHLGQP